MLGFTPRSRLVTCTSDRLNKLLATDGKLPTPKSTLPLTHMLKDLREKRRCQPNRSLLARENTESVREFPSSMLNLRKTSGTPRLTLTLATDANAQAIIAATEGVAEDAASGSLEAASIERAAELQDNARAKRSPVDPRQHRLHRISSHACLADRPAPPFALQGRSE